MKYCYKKLNGYDCVEGIHIYDCMFSLFYQYMFAYSKSPTTSISTHGDIESVTSYEAFESCKKIYAFKVT